MSKLLDLYFLIKNYLKKLDELMVKLSHKEIL